jgi:tellurite resistance protein
LFGFFYRSVTAFKQRLSGKNNAAARYQSPTKKTYLHPMKNTEKLYEAFGELLYVVAMADGEIQASELAVILGKLNDHPWGADIEWSFNYEIKKQRDLDMLYDRVISYCEDHGPDEEYVFLMELLEDVAAASGGVDADEKEVMDSFVYELTERFKRDIDRIQNS